MLLNTRRAATVVLTAAVGLAVAAPAFGQSKFTLRVHTGRGQSGL